MPNRVLKESICTSDDMAALSWFEQALFTRLIVTVDDYGRTDARASIIKGRLFPLDDVKPAEIEKGLKHMEELGMVRLYSVAGKPYLLLTAWTKHQQPRAKISKFPAPEDACNQLQADASNCKQMQADAPDKRYTINDTRYTINDNNVSCAEPAESDPAPEPEQQQEKNEAPPVITLPLNDGTEYPILQADVDKWAGLYPAVDVTQELRNMWGWLDANPAKLKTKKGVRRFVNGWLAKEQNKGGSAPRESPKRNKVGEKLDPNRKSEIEEFSRWAFREIYADAIIDDLQENNQEGGSYGDH